MPKSAQQLPETLRPYRFHGVNLEYKEHNKEAVGDCPFCGREGKFSIDVATGQWRCFICQEGTEKGGGNATTFVRKLWEASNEKLDPALEELAKARSLLRPETLEYWGVCRSIIDGEWLVPGYGTDKKLRQLYRWIKGSDRRKLLPTPGLGYQLFLPANFERGRETVYVCEGIWDAMVLWETMRETGIEDGKLELGTGLLDTSTIVGIPNCGCVGEPFKKWLELFGDRKVVLCFHNDWDKENKGRLVEGAGKAASKRAVSLMAEADNVPTEVRYLHWFDPSLPDGYDIRDWLGKGDTMAERVGNLNDLLELATPVPAEWIGNPKTSEPGSAILESLPCSSWDDLVMAWRPALKWTDGLERALAVMLATITSTESVGDQLWCKIISPPSTGKSVLSEALSIARKYVEPKSVMTGFYSGYQDDKDASQDFSLASRLKNKTLIMKDADTLDKSPKRDTIMAEMRDIYDRCSRTSFKNKASRNYEGLSITIIICGTWSSLHVLDRSDLGPRFINSIIMDRVDEEEEDEIGWRAVNQADIESNYRYDGKPETRDGPELLKAKQMTGGYVEYLRKNFHRLVNELRVPDSVKRQCQLLGKFIAYMRAHPSKSGEDVEEEREASYRIIKQLLRLSKFLAIVLNCAEVDQKVMNWVQACAMDTAKGNSLEIAKKLADGMMSLSALASATCRSEDRQRTLLRFLSKIGVVEAVPPPGPKNRPLWRLTDRLQDLYDSVIAKE